MKRRDDDDDDDDDDYDYDDDDGIFNQPRKELVLFCFVLM